MVRSFRFLFQFARINLACTLGFVLFITAGAWITGVPAGADNLFRTYFSSFPVLLLVILFIFSFSLCTSNLNLALSMGARRRDFFWAIQGIFLLYAGVSWALQRIIDTIPALFRWADRGGLTMSARLGELVLWSYPLTCLVTLALGCLCGLVLARAKRLGILLISLVILILTAGAMVFLTLGTTSVSGPVEYIPSIIAAPQLLLFAASEGLIWRAVRRYSVR